MHPKDLSLDLKCLQARTEQRRKELRTAERERRTQSHTVGIGIEVRRLTFRYPPLESASGVPEMFQWREKKFWDSGGELAMDDSPVLGDRHTSVCRLLGGWDRHWKAPESQLPNRSRSRPSDPRIRTHSAFGTCHRIG